MIKIIQNVSERKACQNYHPENFKKDAAFDI